MRIFLTGRQRSGKDTVAGYLASHYGFSAIALASPIYDIAQGLFGMEHKDRQLLIDIGTHMRQIRPDVFVECALRRSEHPGLGPVVITDVRYRNEWDLLSRAGFVPVGVWAPADIRAQRSGFRPEFETAETEMRVDSFLDQIVDEDVDRLLDNRKQGDYQHLYDQIDTLMVKLGGENE